MLSVQVSAEAATGTETGWDTTVEEEAGADKVTLPTSTRPISTPEAVEELATSPINSKDRPHLKQSDQRNLEPVHEDFAEEDVAAAEAAGRLLSGEAYFAAQEAARAAADREDRKRPQDGGAVGQTWCNTRAVMEGARAPGTFGPGFEGEK